MRLDRRLATLERKASLLTSASVTPRMFWHDELVACTEHPNCDIELADGSHHPNVVHLSWDLRA